MPEVKNLKSPMAPLQAASETTATLLRELVAHLRENRTQLRQEWAQRITEAKLLTAMSADEIFTEATAVYDQYVEALETGTFEALQAYARNLSERIIPRGVETHEVVEIVLQLRDVLARSLFAKYQGYYNGSKSERSDHRKLDWQPNLAQFGTAAGTLALLLVLGAAPSAAWAFDRGGFKARAEATLAELNTKRLADSRATLARLDEMLALGIVGLKEYGASHPKYAKLMDAAIADSQAMKRMTDVEIEEKWGENGTAGDALGIPLKSLADFDGIPRASPAVPFSPHF